jgi:hypothetical protein
MTATIRLATDTSEKVQSSHELAWINDSGDPVYYADLRLVDKFPDLMSIVEVPPVGTFAVSIGRPRSVRPRSTRARNTPEPPAMASERDGRKSRARSGSRRL